MVSLVLGAILGAVLGSLIGCLASRTLTNKTFWGRSYCDSCKKNLSWYDLVPIFSYLFYKGKCRRCQSGIPLDYLLVELVMAVLVGSIFFITFPSLDSLLALNILDVSTQFVLIDLIFKIFAISVLVAVFITDLKNYLIPDRIMVPSIIFAFVYLLLESVYKNFLFFNSLSQSPLGKLLLPPASDYFTRHAFLISYPFLSGIFSAFLIAIAFALVILVTGGRGMGGGDLKLGFFIGLVFGFPDALEAIFLAFFIGAITGVAMILLGRKKFGQTIPFGPFLSTGSLLTLYFGPQILNWYLSLSH